MITHRWLVFIFALGFCAITRPGLALGPPASIYFVEPDDYAEGTVLDNVHPGVKLKNYWANSSSSYPFGIDPFFVRTINSVVNDDIFGGYFTSTGTKSFGRGSFDWIAASHPLAMEFTRPTSQVSIDFIGTSTLSAQVGVLEIYSSSGALLDTFTSGQMFAHQVATLSLARPGSDIAYARAYSSADFSPFGALDNLQFVAVPEPTALAIFGLAIWVFVSQRGCRNCATPQKRRQNGRNGAGVCQVVVTDGL